MRLHREGERALHMAGAAVEVRKRKRERGALRHEGSVAVRGQEPLFVQKGN